MSICSDAENSRSVAIISFRLAYNTKYYCIFLLFGLALFFKFFILTCLFKKISASLTWFISKVYCSLYSSHAPPFLFHLNGRNFMSDNTHIELGIIPLQSYDPMYPSLNVMNAKLLCVKLYLKINTVCLCFTNAELHKIHTANSSIIVPERCISYYRVWKVFTRMKSYKNNKI